MSTSPVSGPPPVRAQDVQILEDALVVHLDDGRTISTPLSWFPRLRDASPEQREQWRFIGSGTGIHWTDLDEDISVGGLLGVPD